MGNSAVFLSYASQDAGPAQRIAEALRAAGIEVWFDKNELVGGDAWDQKIRRQIKDCALFMPIVSANTQARREGYFRLEWKLAEDRTHLMAKGTPFLVPVCIDNTQDWDALVPDSFMSVQWTRLPGGECDPKFVNRVAQLLAGGGPETRPTSPGVARSAVEVEARPPMQTRRRAPALMFAAAGVGVAVALAAILWLRPHPEPAKSAGVTPVATGWPTSPDLRRAMDLINGTEANTEDYALAEELANRAIAQNSTDPEAVIVMARVQNAFLYRGFDRSDERRATARRYAERAVQLAPENPEALGALGIFYSVRSADLDRAGELLNRAIALKPADPFFYRFRDNALFIDRRVPIEKALASAEATAARFPNDALVHYDLARHYRDLGRLTATERELDRTIAITPIANAVVWKSRIALWGRADPAEMKSLIDRVPSRTRSLERVVFSRWIYAMVTNQPEDGLDALGGLTENWIEDFDYVGPKGLLVGQLLELQGKREMARLAYEAALADVRKRQQGMPANVNMRNNELWLLKGLGRDDEARGLNRVVNESLMRPFRFATLSDWWFTAIPRCLLTGDRATALQLIREAVTAPKGAESRRETESSVGEETGPESVARAALALRFKIDPRMTPFRDDPEIVALLSPPAADGAVKPAERASVVPDEKAVAVLAFENLSGDKDNEYFSDGVSEELINVLGRVPGLTVRGRTSAFFFKGRNATAQEIGQKLSVAYLVRGSVRRDGNRVRITAQLSRAATDEVVWSSESLDRELKDVFAVQDEIAGLIARALSLKLGTSFGTATATVNPQALEYYLRANQIMRLRDTVFTGVERVEELLNQALAIEPNFARAHAMLAEAWSTPASLLTRSVGSRFDQRNSPSRQRIEAKARQAIALDPASAEAHTALALIMWLRWDRAGAERELHAALAQNPSFAVAHWRLGYVLMDDGRMDEAIAEMKLATQLDPFSQDSIEACARVLHVAGRYTEAIAMYDRALALADSLVGREHKAYALAQLGRTAEALALAGTLPESERFRILVTAGRPAEAEAQLAASPYISLYKLFVLGRTEGALAALDADAMDSTYVHDWLFEPWFDPVRNDPRFKQLLETVGLTAAHARAQAWRAAHPRESSVPKP